MTYWRYTPVTLIATGALMLSWVPTAAVTVFGQTYTPMYAPPAVVAPAVPALTVQQLDQLTGPIALYPDPLLAQLLPAATYPLEVIAADQWLHANPQATEQQIDGAPWEPPVKALLHYPSVLDMLAGQISWMQSLGSAFTYQPADVMNSIQRLRAQAQVLGTLATTPQQQVLVDNGNIQVLPATPDVIYVPVYDPGVVYVRRPDNFALNFGTGFHTGVWLNFDFDWRNHYVNDNVRWGRDWRPVVVAGPERHWERNPIKPMPVRGPIERRDDRAEPRGWARPAGNPSVFGGYQPRGEAEHAEDRMRQVRPGSVTLPRTAPMPGPVRGPAPGRPVGNIGDHGPAGPGAGPGPGNARNGGGGGRPGR